MKVILDVNILLSALIKDSKTREIILKSGFEFYFPEISLTKIRKYKKYIIDKADMTEESYSYVLTTLFHFIRLISNEELKNQWNEAKKVMEHIDPEDVVFVACALSVQNSVVWSDDKHFEKQDIIITLKTKEIINIFKKN